MGGAELSVSSMMADGCADSNRFHCMGARVCLQCGASFPVRPVEPVMVYRPRTKAKIAKKQKRCTKCSALVSYRSRCKKCHKAVS